MAKIISIANQKGGIGKTTTACALASGLKNKNKRVLLVDLDPQGNVSIAYGINNYNCTTIYDVLKKIEPPENSIQKLNGFDFIPSNIMLAGAENEFSQIGKEQLLKETLFDIKSNYDYIILDTPPNLGLLTVNSFTFSNEVIIPTTAGIFAAVGIKQLSDTIENVKKYCNKEIVLKGILLTKYNPRANNNKDMKDLIEKIATSINTKLFNTYIRSSIIIEEVQSKNKDIFDYKDNNNVVMDYNKFVNEYLEGEL